MHQLLAVLFRMSKVWWMASRNAGATCELGRKENWGFRASGKVKAKKKENRNKYKGAVLGEKIRPDIQVVPSHATCTSIFHARHISKHPHFMKWGRSYFPNPLSQGHPMICVLLMSGMWFKTWELKTKKLKLGEIIFWIKCSRKSRPCVSAVKLKLFSLSFRI